MDPEWNDEVGYLIDEEIVLTHWQAPGEGERLRPVQLALSSHEVGASTPTVGLTPYTSEYEGYMGNYGNYGNTMDRWYRRAAVLVWPTALGFANRAETDPAWALADLTRRLRTPEPQGQDNRERVEADLRSLHPFWAATVRVTSEPLLRTALEVAALLDQPEDAAFLIEPFDITQFGPGETAAFGKAVDRYGEGWGRERLRSWVGADRHYGGLAELPSWLGSLPQTCAGLAGAPGCASNWSRSPGPSWRGGYGCFSHRLRHRA